MGCLISWSCCGVDYDGLLTPGGREDYGWEAGRFVLQDEFAALVGFVVVERGLRMEEEEVGDVLIACKASV